MIFDVQFKPRALRDLASLSPEVAQRIVTKIERLQNGLSSDVKRLTNFTPEYRLRVGPYRVLFETADKTIVVYRVLHRREAYN